MTLVPQAEYAPVYGLFMSVVTVMMEGRVERRIFQYDSNPARKQLQEANLFLSQFCQFQTVPGHWQAGYGVLSVEKIPASEVEKGAEQKTA